MQLVLAWSHAERFLRCISHSQQQVAAPMRTGTGMRLEPVGAFSQAEWHINGERLAGHLPTMHSRHARASLSLIRASIHHYKHASSLLRAEGALWLRAYPGREHAAHHYRLASTSLLRYCMAHAHQSFITSSVLVLQASST